MGNGMAGGTVIQNGQVYDGSGAPAVDADVRIRGESIAEIGPHLPLDGDNAVDATGLLVVPGLIDLHAHVFGGAGLFALDPDQAGLPTGVTTVLDTGTAGALTYKTFHRFVISQAQEDIYALLNISIIGCLQGHPDFEPVMGELSDARYCHVPSTVECIKQFPDRLVGSKVRLSAMLADDRPENEQVAFRGALEAASQTGTFLMVHHSVSNVPTDEMLDALRPGDVVTHLYHPKRDSAFEGPDRTPSQALLRARQRGVVLDVGHGIGSFGWVAAEPACRQHGFWPDTISTDLHAFCVNGPVHDMPTTMSKFLHLGMPMTEVIRASTQRPAEVLKCSERVGTLQPQRQADITLLRLEEGPAELYDVLGQSRVAGQRLVPVSVFKRGVHHECRRAELTAPSPDTWSIPGANQTLDPTT